MEQTRFNRYRGFILILLLAMIGISPRPGRTKSLLNSASGETLSQQVARDVEEALDTFTDSATLHDWRASGFTPTDVLKNAFALRRVEARYALCSALGKLSTADLSHYEAALQSHMAAQKLDCAPKLLKRIQNYWIAQTAAADAARFYSSVADVGPVALGHDERVVDLSSVHQITSRLLNQGEFALVFEGALNPMTTRQVLESLEDRGARATFLMPGISAREYPELVRAMARDDDIVGSQGAGLQDFTTFDMDDAGQQIDEGTEAVSTAEDGPSLFFAFPGESSNAALESLVRSKGLEIVRGDLELQDWKVFNAGDLIKIAGDLIHHSRKGILVMQSDLHQTAIALPAILDTLAYSHDRVVTFQVR